jgi:hypothetical protein
LHIEPNNYSIKVGLYARHPIIMHSFADSGFGVKIEDILFREQHLLNSERSSETYNVE